MIDRPPNSRTNPKAKSLLAALWQDGNCSKIFTVAFVFVLCSISFLASSFCVSGSAGAAQKIYPVDDPALKFFVRDYVWLQTNFSAVAKREFLATPEGRKQSMQYHTYNDCYLYEHLEFWSKYEKLILSTDTSPYLDIADVRPNREIQEILREPKKIVIDIQDIVVGYLENRQEIRTNLHLAEGESFFRLESDYVHKLLQDRALETECKVFEDYRRKNKLTTGAFAK